METERISLKNHRDWLADVSNRTIPAHGFFGPNSLAWQVNRDMGLGLVAMRALLMQVAHPAVARGVAEHSGFNERPYKRAYSTLRAQQRIVFGSTADAMAALLAMQRRHAGIRGDGYHALDGGLQLWVWGTLIDSTLYGMRLISSQGVRDNLERFYDESKWFGELLGLPLQLIPTSLKEFNGWFDEMISGPALKVEDDARRIAQSLFRLPARLMVPFNKQWAAITLPECLRRAYLLPEPDPMARRGFRLLISMIKMIPIQFRTQPAYLRAKLRVRVHGNSSL